MFGVDGTLIPTALLRKMSRSIVFVDNIFVGLPGLSLLIFLGSAVPMLCWQSLLQCIRSAGKFDRSSWKSNSINFDCFRGSLQRAAFGAIFSFWMADGVWRVAILSVDGLLRYDSLSSHS